VVCAFVPSDSTVENMNVLERYMKKRGRPLAVYTDQAALFKTAQKTKPGEAVAVGEQSDLPPTQLGRALQELESCGSRHTVRRPRAA